MEFLILCNCKNRALLKLIKIKIFKTKHNNFIMIEHEFSYNFSVHTF